MQAQAECSFIQHGQRPHRHAALDAGVFDHRGRDTFAQHGSTLHHKGAEHPAGEEAARVIDHDGQLANGLHIVKSTGHGLVIGLRAADDLDQLHLVDRAEEMDADKLVRRHAGLGQTADGQGGGVGGEKAAWRQHRLGFLGYLGLERAVLEHRFDDQVTAIQVGRLGGGLDVRQQGVARGLAQAPFGHAGLGQFGAVGLAGLSFLLAHIFEHGGNAFAGLHIGDAGAHHAGAQQADPGWLVALCLARARLAALDRVHVEEKGVDHGAGVGAGDQLRQVAALDAQRRGHIHLQALDHAGQNCLRGGVAAASLFFEHGRRYRQHGRHFGVGRGAAGHLVVFGFPSVLGGGVGVNPGQGLGLHLGLRFGARCHQRMHQAQGQRILRRKQLAFHQIRLGTQQAEVARHFGDATGAGQQTQRDLGQAELDARVIHRDAVVPDQRHLPTAAQGGAVEAAHDRSAQGLQRAEVLLDAFDAGVHGRGVGRCQAHGGFEVGTRKKRAFGRGQHDAANGRTVLQHLHRQGLQVFLPLLAHGVDRRVWLVKGDGGDAVLQAVADGVHQSLSTMVAMPMPPPTHRVARP